MVIISGPGGTSYECSDGRSKCLIRFHGVLPLGEVDILLMLPRRLLFLLVL